MKRIIYFTYLNFMKGSKQLARKTYHKIDQTISNMLKSTYVEKEGHKFFLDKGDTSGFSVKDYEPGSIKLVQKLIKPGDFVIDLGANIGYYSLTFAKLVGAKGKVFAFEPEPNIFKLLEKNIQVNNYTNIFPIEKAVIDKEGEDNLYVSRNCGSSVMYNEFNESQDEKPIEVKTTTLDYFFKDVNHEIAFIKIDCDGSETRIIKAGKRFFEKNKNIKMLVEFVPYRIKDSGITPQEFLDLIESFGFKIYEVDEYEPKYKPAKLNELIVECERRDKNPEGQGGYINLLCVKEDLH